MISWKFLISLWFDVAVSYFIEILHEYLRVKKLKHAVNVKALWATRETEDTKENRELHVKTTLRELCVFIVFLVVLCIGKVLWFLSPVNSLPPTPSPSSTAAE